MRTYRGYFRREPLYPANEQNQRIKRAYDNLAWMERDLVDDSIDRLCEALKDAGPQTAREILAAVGRLMIEKGQPE